jgi:hypothetical protein
MAKELTRAQAERKKAQAAAFMERIEEPDRADEFDSMSVEEYAEHKGLRIANPKFKARSKEMATTSLPSKSDLQDQIDSAIEILDGAYEPESTREDLAEAVGSALEVLRGEDEDEGDEDEGDDDYAGD